MTVPLRGQHLLELCKRCVSKSLSYLTLVQVRQVRASSDCFNWLWTVCSASLESLERYNVEGPLPVSDAKNSAVGFALFVLWLLWPCVQEFVGRRFPKAKCVVLVRIWMPPCSLSFCSVALFYCSCCLHACPLLQQCDRAISNWKDDPYSWSYATMSGQSSELV